MIDSALTDTIIIGRVEPQVYAFSTQTVPNYLKVGDTYRSVEQRLNEWKHYFPNLKKCFETIAKVSNDTYFRDYAIHYFLEHDLQKYRLQRGDIPNLPYYSQEFFKNTTVEELEMAIKDIKKDYDNNKGKYQFYNFESRPTSITYTYKRGDTLLELRPNQKATVENFIKAIKHGRTNLLMYAVMRFGKTFTALSCALTSPKCKTILVISGKADVANEWKRTVESIKNFENFDFIDSRVLYRNPQIVSETISKGHRPVVFLTLQDLSGAKLKAKHQEVFTKVWDLLIIDETHYGARAEEYGKVLKNASSKELKYADTAEDYEQNADFKRLRAAIRLHLSGTPYRILMGNEFQDEDIIAFYQFTDIVREQKAWDAKFLADDNRNEWDNPYFGFPQMIRFAFNVNESSMRKIEELRKNHVEFALNELLRPQSVTKQVNGRHLLFQHEQEVFELLQAIDGTKEDNNIFGFLNYDKIKQGKMCRHIICVLPYRASCDAMEALIKSHTNEFKNLGEYEILNIAGVDDERKFHDVREITQKIAECEKKDHKTLTLTVNRMLTGTTVEQWDTMIYLKDTASPQEYDQAIFRLQNQYVREYTDTGGNVIKRNMKPQTLLIDFEPGRMFRMQEAKAKIYNVRTEKRGNTKLEQRIEEELRISPIIVVNKDRMQLVEPCNIVDKVREYSATKSIMDEATDIPIDTSLLSNFDILNALNTLNPINSRKGIVVKANKGEGNDLDSDEEEENERLDTKGDNDEKETKEDEELTLQKKLSSYYSLILFFAFLTNSRVKSLEDILRCINANEDNKRIAANVGISDKILRIIQGLMNPFILSELDYKINNMNTLARDTMVTPSERVKCAMNKFGRLSSSEIVTPHEVASMMVSFLPKERISNTTKILDIASKQGEFANALFERFGNKVKHNIYSLPTSPLTYEFTRKVYALLGFPIKNVISEYNTYDMIRPNKKEHLMSYLRTCNFGIIIGNPPYQDEPVGDQKTFNGPIYNLFLDESYGLAPLVEMIHPARFLSGAGGTPKPWNRQMLEDCHLRIAHYEGQSKKLFPDTEIKGGLAVSMRDKMVSHTPIKLFTPFAELKAIVRKVSGREDFESFSTIVFTRTAYRFTDLMHSEHPEALGQLSEGHPYDVSTNIFERLPQVFYTEIPNDGKEYIQIIGRIGNDRTKKYIRREYIRPVENLDSYKVLMSNANNTGAYGEILTPPFLAEPKMGNTETFISIGKLQSASEAESVIKYLHTKFLRALLGILKTTQHLSPEKFRYVPLQDFTSHSDIDWTQSISDIDEQLYEKYALTTEECDFIKKNIKPMPL